MTEREREREYMHVCVCFRVLKTDPPMVDHFKLVDKDACSALAAESVPILVVVFALYSRMWKTTLGSLLRVTVYPVRGLPPHPTIPDTLRLEVPSVGFCVPLSSSLDG